MYILARTNPAFNVGQSALGQVFCNPCSSADAADAADAANPDASSASNTQNRQITSEEADLQQAAAQVPTHSSSISTHDGYLPSAMLFVDEEFVSHRCAREQRIGALVWRPTVRFCSSHYNYVNDENGLRIVQTGIGVDKRGLHFQTSPSSAVSEAKERPPKSSSTRTKPL